MPTGYTIVSGSALKDSTDTLVTNATISFQPVSNTGVPIAFMAGGGGQTIFKAVSAPVTAGVFTIQLADTTLTTPVHIGYAVTVTDNLTGDQLLGPGYGCIQPFGAAWNFDTYVPNLPAQTTIQLGPNGLSAYQIAIANGFSGTQAQWLSSLVGPSLSIDVVTSGSTGSPQTLVFAHNLGTFNPDCTWQLASGPVPDCNPPIFADANTVTIVCRTSGSRIRGNFVYMPSSSVIATQPLYDWESNELTGTVFANSGIGPSNDATHTAVSVGSSTTSGFTGFTGYTGGMAFYDPTHGNSSSVTVQPNVFAPNRAFTLSFFCSLLNLGTILADSLNFTTGGHAGVFIGFVGSVTAPQLKFSLVETTGARGIIVPSVVMSVSTTAAVHYAVSYDGSGHASGVKFYCNGVPVAQSFVNADSLLTTDTTANSGNPIWIGRQPDNSNPMTGIICRVKLYAFQPTDAFIAALHAAGA